VNEELLISKRVQDLAPSGIRAFFDLVIGMKGVISLGVGEPDFVTPWNIRESAIYSVEKGYTTYTSNKGLMELRTIISQFLNKKFSLKYDPDSEILITVGVSEALDLAMRALLDDGDEMIIPEPSYVSYGPTVSLASGKPVFLTTGVENGFRVKTRDIERTITKRTKGLILNYPCNPTGASLRQNELQEIADLVQKRNMIVISDEIYDALTYDFDHVPLPAIEGMKERTVYLNGFSKAYAMTGWRVGYAAGPPHIIDAMTRIHQYTMLCAPICGQMAACEAVKNGEASVREMKNEYNRRRRFIVNGLNKIGLNCHMPDGAFYAFPSVKSTGLDSMTFATKLLEKEKVAVVPGTAFGKSGEGYVRLSYASSLENIREALTRMERFLRGLHLLRC
jgi:aminotransferase